MLQFIERDLTAEELEQYGEQGFVNYGPLVGEESIVELRHEVDGIWEAANRTFDGGVSWNQNALVNGAHKESALLRDVLYRGPLVGVMTQIIGPNVKLASNQLVFKHPGDDRPYGWHQDNGFGPLAPENAVTCWTALDDTHEQNGCLWVIPGSHRGGVMEHRQERGRERIALVEDEGRAVPLRMKAGECVLFHGSLLHMSKGNRTGRVRRAYFFRYADADAVEVLTGRPRVGKLLRGVSRFPEVTNCPEMVCQPSANDLPDAASRPLVAAR